MKTSNPPKIFRASDAAAEPKFPFDNIINDHWIDDKICPSCNKPFADHDDRKIVKCALAELRGDRKN